MSMAENIPNGSGKHGPAAPAAVKIAAPANGWTRKDRPCDACRRRKGRCIIPQDTETCIMCQSRSEECTFVETPQRRKRRKLEDQGSPESARITLHSRISIVLTNSYSSPGIERSLSPLRTYLKAY
jgi:hypothetical protein